MVIGVHARRCGPFRSLQPNVFDFMDGSTPRSGLVDGHVRYVEWALS